MGFSHLKFILAEGGTERAVSKEGGNEQRGGVS